MAITRNERAPITCIGYFAPIQTIHRFKTNIGEVQIHVYGKRQLVPRDHYYHHHHHQQHHHYHYQHHHHYHYYYYYYYYCNGTPVLQFLFRSIFSYFLYCNRIYLTMIFRQPSHDLCLNISTRAQFYSKDHRYSTGNHLKKLLYCC